MMVEILLDKVSIFWEGVRMLKTSNQQTAFINPEVKKKVPVCAAQVCWIFVCLLFVVVFFFVFCCFFFLGGGFVFFARELLQQK